MKNKREDLLSYIGLNKELKRKQQIMLVIKLSIPTILAQMASIVMQYIDAAMVGRLGANGPAAIGLVASTTWLFGSVCFAVIVGFGVQAVQSIGARKNEEAGDVLKAAFITVLGISATLALIGTLLSNNIPIFLNGEEGIRKDAAVYFFIYASSIPLIGLNGLGASMLQGAGNMKIPSILNIMMCIIDVILNWLLIFPEKKVFFLNYTMKIPGADLGVAGAALGTAIAELITAILMLYFLCFRTDIFKNELKKKFKIKLEYIKKAIKISYPVAFESIVMCGAMIASTKIVAPLGSVALAAHSFAITTESLCYMPGYGIGRAATTLTGQSFGAGRKKLAKEFGNLTVFLGIGVMTFMGIIMFVFAPEMFAFLTPDKDVQATGVAILRIEAFAEPMYAASIVASGVFQGAGDTFIPSIMNFISMWAVRIPLSYFLAKSFGLKGVWIAMCIELCFRGIIFLLRLRNKKWLENKK